MVWPWAWVTIAPPLLLNYCGWVFFQNFLKICFRTSNFQDIFRCNFKFLLSVWVILNLVRLGRFRVVCLFDIVLSLVLSIHVFRFRGVTTWYQSANRVWIPRGYGCSFWAHRISGCVYITTCLLLTCIYCLSYIC